MLILPLTLEKERFEMRFLISTNYSKIFKAISFIIISFSNISFASISMTEIQAQTNKALSQSAVKKTPNATTLASKAEEVSAPQATSLIGQLASNGYALIYFFDSKCPNCQRFSPIVKDIAMTYGFKVYDFSFDNQGLASFKHPAPVKKEIYQAYYGNTTPFSPVLILQNVNDMSFYVLSKGEMPKGLLIQQLETYAKELLNA